VIRIEELAFKYADGFLNEGEWSELERLVIDPRAARVAVAALELEGALRGQRRSLDVWRAVIGRLRRDLP
jgi:hypothetical protein